jgi:hypothetical protein
MKIPVRMTMWRVSYFWIVIAGAILLQTIPAPAAENFHDIRVQDANATRPQLIFACDRQTKELDSLFTPQLISDLKELNAGVALSTEDFSAERAEVVRRLNAAGVPMTAWIALPKDQGYYVNVSTATQTAARFAEFDKWRTDNGLKLEAVGLDIEPTLKEYSALTGHKGQLISMAIKRALDSGRVKRGRETYVELIRQIQSRGYKVQTYQLTFMADERNAHTTLLERIFGIVDVRGDQEVFMLYTSFVHQFGAAQIWQYAPSSQIIAVGSTATSGDVKVDTQYPPLSWEEFSRDLIVAHHFSPIVGVYSLEGCVHQGFIPKLKTMDWTQAVVIPAESLKQAAQAKNGIHAVLWLGSHLIYFILAFLLVFIWIVWMIVRWRKRRWVRKLNQVGSSA